jgi:DNA-binding HxlR family transcriptional regulator
MNSQKSDPAILRSVAKRYGQHCPVAQSLDLVGERWTLLIVRDLLRGPARFQELREQLAGIPPKLLADRLRRMERQGLVARALYSTRPPRASYALTDRGRGLGLVVAALAMWGRPFVGSRSGPRHATCGHPIELQQYCAHCEERVAPGTVHVPAAAAPTAGRRDRRRSKLRQRPKRLRTS